MRTCMGCGYAFLTPDFLVTYQIYDIPFEDHQPRYFHVGCIFKIANQIREQLRGGSE